MLKQSMLELSDNAAVESKSKSVSEVLRPPTVSKVLFKK